MQGLLSEVNFGRVVWSFTGCIWEVFNGSLGVYVGLILGLLAGCLVYSGFVGRYTHVWFAGLLEMLVCILLFGLLWEVWEDDLGVSAEWTTKRSSWSLVSRR